MNFQLIRQSHFLPICLRKNRGPGGSPPTPSSRKTGEIIASSRFHNVINISRKNQNARKNCEKKQNLALMPLLSAAGFFVFCRLKFFCRVKKAGIAARKFPVPAALLSGENLTRSLSFLGKTRNDTAYFSEKCAVLSS